MSTPEPYQFNEFNEDHMWGPDGQSTPQEWRQKQDSALVRAIKRQQTELDREVEKATRLPMLTLVGSMVTRSIVRGDHEAALDWANIRSSFETDTKVDR